MKTAKQMLILLLAYLLVAVPFKVLGVIPGFTDIRPVVLLGPIYAVFFGLPGCTVMAVGNLIMDVVSDSLRWSSIPGFLANFLGPWLIWLYWVRRSPSAFSLRKGQDLCRHVLVVLLAAALQTILITPAVAMVYPEVDAQLFALTVMLNNAVFPIVFGIPVMILMQEELGFRPLHRHIKK